MKLQMMSIRDSAVNAFMTPFFAQSVGAAIRSFQDAVNDESIPMSKHPEDYELFHVGEWSDEECVFKTLPPKSVARAVDFKR